MLSCAQHGDWPCRALPDTGSRGVFYFGNEHRTKSAMEHQVDEFYLDFARHLDPFLLREFRFFWIPFFRIETSLAGCIEEEWFSNYAPHRDHFLRLSRGV